MHYKTLFKSGLLILATLMLLASCDKDFNEIGSDIIGDDHLGFELFTETTVNAFNQATAAVQSNNLPLNSLGIYNNPVFGKTKAGFVTQLEMASPNPTFDMDRFVSMDSVVLTVPYFSQLDDKSPTGYKLDSINGSGAINLKVFESGYFLSDLDPSTNFEDTQKYYTNQESVFNNTKINVQLNDSINKAENDEFVPSAKEFVVKKRDAELKFTNSVERYSPRMSLNLNKEHFYNKIFKHPAGKLMNNSLFKGYFKGLYFQVADADSGTLMRLNFSKGDVTLYYTEWENSEKKKKVLKSFVLNMKGNTVNLIEQTNSPTYAGMIASRPLDPLPNDEKLYVKGGAGGSTAIIDLFGNDLHGADGETGQPNGVADELDIIRNNGWLINEANLTFSVDDAKMSGAPQPQRIFLFDVNNRRPIYDYNTDVTTVSSNPKLNKSVLGGIIETKNGESKYKIRITNHIRNLVKYADSTNVRLGLVVTESVGVIGNSKLEKSVSIPFPFGEKMTTFDRVPFASVMNPLGTILYGSNPANVPEDKRLKLEIYYTKPKK